ncbi:MAG: hypothetical protein SA339_10270 [Methanomassiliicoccus sp.]|nr:hypothetical protein [Methanomassiliicoccus sp.]
MGEMENPEKEIINYFKSPIYTAAIATKEDFSEISKLINDYVISGDDRSEAIYKRTEEELEFSISNGLFVKIEDDNSKIVAIIGAYPVSYMEGSIEHNLVEIGTLVSILQEKSSNTSMGAPRYWLFDFLIKSAVINVLSLERKKMSIKGKRQDLVFERLICNIQAPLVKHKERLTSEELGWEMLEVAEIHGLNQICSTTVSDEEKAGREKNENKTEKEVFTGKEKNYFQFQARLIPEYANYLSDCIKNGAIRGGSYDDPANEKKAQRHRQSKN